MKAIPVRQLQEEVDLALWDIECGSCPHCALERFWLRLRTRCEAARRAGIVFRFRRLTRLDRGGIAW